MIPQLESPPRVRVEWLIAGARLLLATGTVAAIVWPRLPSRELGALLASYLAYSVALVALVWTPIRFARGWDVVVHIVDIAACAAWALAPEGVASPMVAYYVFAVVCGTIRWHLAGTLWTAAAVVAGYSALGLSPLAARIGGAGVPFEALAPQVVYLLLMAAFVAYLGRHQSRFQYEIGRLASWPRKPSQDPHELVSEIVRQSSEFLGAPRVVLVWEEPGEGWVNVAWQDGDLTKWTREPEATYGAFVLPGLERSSFQVRDASSHDQVLLLRSGGFRRRECRPVNEALRARFEMTAVQSWPLSGELVRGRLFCLDKRRMRLDDLVLGEVVAWLAVTRIESLYWQERLREAAALDERVRLARDLHDSLLQAQAGAALQLVAARRLLDRDPAAGRQRLADVQEQLERDELEMRSFVARLRPTNRSVGVPGTRDLRERLDDLRQRVERQWEIRVRLNLGVVDGLPDDLVEGVYRLAQEGVVNAARHADASVIDVELSRADGRLRLRVADDGHGFPFRGTYDLAALNRMGAGPLTLKERVSDLGGEMTIVSAETGAELLIVLPLARVHV